MVAEEGLADIQQLNSIFKGLSYKRMQFLKLDETFRTDYHVIIILNAGFLSIAVKGDLWLLPFSLCFTAVGLKFKLGVSGKLTPC